MQIRFLVKRWKVQNDYKVLRVFWKRVEPDGEYTIQESSEYLSIIYRRNEEGKRISDYSDVVTLYSLELIKPCVLYMCVSVQSIGDYKTRNIGIQLGVRSKLDVEVEFFGNVYKVFQGYGEVVYDKGNIEGIVNFRKYSNREPKKLVIIKRRHNE